jgi:hypothetical protein
MATQGCAKPAQLTRESALPLPDFRGVWFLDPKKSHLADTTRTTTLEVWRHGDTLIVETATNDQFGYSTSTGRYGFDGKPWLDARPDARLSTVMSWDGPTLVFRTSGDMRGLKVTVIAWRGRRRLFHLLPALASFGVQSSCRNPNDVGSSIHELWFAPVPGTGFTRSMPAATASRVVFAAGDGSITSRDPATGSAQWRRTPFIHA